MCHIRIAILPAASLLSTTLAQPALAQDAGSFAQKFANSLTALPAENLSVTDGFYATDDVRGGTGANFIVDRAATGEITEPVVEAPMVGGVANARYASISQDRPTRSVGKN